MLRDGRAVLEGVPRAGLTTTAHRRRDAGGAAARHGPGGPGRGGPGARRARDRDGRPRRCGDGAAAPRGRVGPRAAGRGQPHRGTGRDRRPRRDRGRRAHDGPRARERPAAAAARRGPAARRPPGPPRAARRDRRGRRARLGRPAALRPHARQARCGTTSARSARSRWPPTGRCVSARRLRAHARDQVERLQVRTPSIDARAGELSGGNQQKVVFAKWLDAQPSVLLLDDPTRGVDVGAKAEMHALVRGAAAAGAVVLLTSTDLDELADVCDRVLVFHRGAIGAELAGERAPPARPARGDERGRSPARLGSPESIQIDELRSPGPYRSGPELRVTGGDAWYVRARSPTENGRPDGRYDDDAHLPDELPRLARRGDRAGARAGDHRRRAQPRPAARHEGGAARALRRRARDDQRGDPAARDARDAHGAARSGRRRVRHPRVRRARA